MSYLRGSWIVSLAVLLLAGCAGSPDPSEGAPDVDLGVASAVESGALQLSWAEDVQPVLEQRCIGCHGCFDAPCQLKLSSYAGVERGANPKKVYDGARIFAAEPTRLFIDATTPAQWQSKGFHDVLGSLQNPDASPDERLRNSLLYKMLRLKQTNPQPRTGLLPDSITLSLDRKQVCTKAEDFDKFARERPLWGMPYGLPNLTDREFDVLAGWIAAGAPAPEPYEPAAAVTKEVRAWEAFLNGTSDKEQLVSRYLYEHLFLGHLKLDSAGDREFYRLVRSSTPPGEPVQEIPTVRPFDDPGAEKFWYRLRYYDSSIVAKAHVVYPFGEAKRERLQEIFLAPDYPVGTLPGYVMPEAANPFISFAAIPAEQRFQFMLDDARFFIQGFIKGPVCRGQVALNVIEDQFWVFFTDPASVGAADRDAALHEVADYLQMPTSTDTLRIRDAYSKYWKKQKEYLAVKTQFYAEHRPPDAKALKKIIWDGGGTNPNAALTVFRNFDSAAVEFGLLGNYPETAWIVDYPLFERIHYLLVAGFDVYGNVGHQLNSRLFMDFLRMEGEDNFLLLLPADQRQTVRDQWYQGIREDRKKYFQEPMSWLQIESPLTFTTNDPEREALDFLIAHVGPKIAPPDDLNRCAGSACGKAEDPAVERANDAMRRLAKLHGATLDVFPDLAFIRLRVPDQPDLYYTLIYNKMYANLSSMLRNEETQARDKEHDTVTVLPRFSGSYPNAFFVVDLDQADEFVIAAESVETRADYLIFANRYGVSRTDGRFWAQSDWFNKEFAEAEPEEWGILDLSRYLNF